MASFTIRDVAELLQVKRLGDGNSFDAVCPYCGDARGKMGMRICRGGQVMNTFHCFHCGAGGNMLTLYADLTGMTGLDRCKRAYRELIQIFNGNGKDSALTRGYPEQARSQEKAPVQALDATYRRMLSILPLLAEHRDRLMDRGLTRGQVEYLQARSVPEGEGARVARLLKADGLLLEGVPGFYKNAKGSWAAAFPKASGIMFPIPDEAGNYCGIQIRMDHVKSGRKYLWLSSGKYREGASSGSPAAFWGDMENDEISVTEGGLKAYCVWCFTGRPCVGLAGVGQTRGLEGFLKKRKGTGLKLLECMDMDKYMDVSCDGNEKGCESCTELPAADCPAKVRKRTCIREGCNRLYGLSGRNGAECRRIVWHIEAGSLWDGKAKGIDDYLLDVKKSAGRKSI